MPFLSPNQQCQSTEGLGIALIEISNLSEAFTLMLCSYWFVDGKGVQTDNYLLWLEVPKPRGSVLGAKVQFDVTREKIFRQ